MWHRMWSGPVLPPPPSPLFPCLPDVAPQAPSCLDLRCAIHLPGPSPSALLAVAFPPSHLTACFRHWGGLCSRDIFQVLAYTPLPGESFPTTLWAGASLSSRCTCLLCQARCSMGLFPAAASIRRAGLELGRHAGRTAGRVAGRILTAALGGVHPVPGTALSALWCYISPLRHSVVPAPRVSQLRHRNVKSSRGRAKIHARLVCALGHRPPATGHRPLPNVLGRRGWGGTAAQGPGGHFAAELSSSPGSQLLSLCCTWPRATWGGLVPPKCVFSGARAQVRHRKASAGRSALGTVGTPGSLGLCWLCNWADVSLSCQFIGGGG